MFVRKKRINGKEYFYLCKTYRDNGKVRQKVVQYIGDADKLKEWEAQQ